MSSASRSAQVSTHLPALQPPLHFVTVAPSLPSAVHSTTSSSTHTVLPGDSQPDFAFGTMCGLGGGGWSARSPSRFPHPTRATSKTRRRIGFNDERTATRAARQDGGLGAGSASENPPF